jgi:AcrR family transcriptional regulator
MDLSEQRLEHASAPTSDGWKKARTDRRIRSLGGKGLRTRASIVAMTLQLLAQRPLPDVTMANVAKELGLTKTAFYRHFGEIAEVLLDALDGLTAEASGLLPLIVESWREDDPYASALKFVDSYQALWQRHAALIRARNSLADAGDARFIAARRETAQPLAFALAVRLGATAPGAAPLAPAFSMASLLIMAVERAATVVAQNLYPEQAWAELRLGLAEMVRSAVLERARGVPDGASDRA